MGSGRARAREPRRPEAIFSQPGPARARRYEGLFYREFRAWPIGTLELQRGITLS